MATPKKAAGKAAPKKAAGKKTAGKKTAGKKTAGKGSGKSKTVKPKLQSASETTASGLAGVSAPASTPHDKTASEIAAEQTPFEQHTQRSTAEVVQPNGHKVQPPVSTPENTNNGAAPYGAPKQDYGGNQTQEPVYMGDVIS